MMEFDLEKFMGNPTREKLETYTKEHLKLIAEKLEISVSKQDRKKLIKDQLLSVLVERGVRTCR